MTDRRDTCFAPSEEPIKTETFRAPTNTPGRDQALYKKLRAELDIHVDLAHLTAKNHELLDLLTLALPYIEEAEWDKTNKPGAVAKLTKRIRAALEDSTHD